MRRLVLLLTVISVMFLTSCGINIVIEDDKGKDISVESVEETSEADEDTPKKRMVHETEEVVEVEEVEVVEEVEDVENKSNSNENILSSMSAAEKREINIFLSNFSEAYYEPNGFYGEAEAKISFAHIHATINNYNVTFYQGNDMGIPAKEVDKILIRFFGSSVPHKTPDNSKYWRYENGNFVKQAASGDSYPDFSIATDVKKRADGNIDVSFNIYSDPSITGGDCITDKTVYSLSDGEANVKYDYCKSGSAVLKPKGNTYELVDYMVY